MKFISQTIFKLQSTRIDGYYVCLHFSARAMVRGQTQVRQGGPSYSDLRQSEYSQILASSVAMILIMMMVVMMSIVEIKRSSYRTFS